MNRALISIAIFLLILVAAGCKSEDDKPGTPNQDTSNTENKLLFRTIGNMKPEKEAVAAAVLNELETRMAIQQFVTRRTDILQVTSTSNILKNELSRMPGKFRYTEIYQQKAKEIEEQEKVEKTAMRTYYKELDLLADKFRRYEERTPSGVWKLTEFYDAFEPAAAPENKPYWDAYILNIEDWIAQNPKSPTPRIALAYVLIKRAWAHRTTLPASYVSPEAWKAFEYFISQARNYLDQNKVVAGEDPHWYAVMAIVATAEGWPLDKFLALMEEGSSRYPYYYPIYFTGMSYLLPRWQGSFEKMEAFANAAVEKTKEQDKTGLYARVYWSASGTIKKHRLFSDSGVDWIKMRQGIFDVLEQYPDQWNINNFAYFACIAKDRETTKTLTDQIKTPIKSVWEATEVLDACKEWADGKDSGLLDMIMDAR